MTFEQRIDWFSERNLIMLFLWKDHFLNPLVPEQLQKLKSSGLLDNKYLLKVLEEYLPELDAELPRGMYFPVPISRSLSEGGEFSTILAGQFFYDFIRVDDSQKWSLRDKYITGKVLSLFESNLFYEKETSRYYVEYWSDSRWDKCYLECAITPMLGLSVENIPNGLKLELNNHKTDLIDLHSFRIDAEERCFAFTLNHGEVQLADTPRFWLLNQLDETGTQLFLNKQLFPLNISS
jgi:hypothetical protein